MHCKGFLSQYALSHKNCKKLSHV